MARIALDIDDTLVPFVDPLREYLVYQHKVPRYTLPTPTKWCLHEQWGMSEHELWKLIDIGVDEDDLYRNTPPTPSDVRALHSLKEDGHTIHLVTARRGGSYGITELSTACWLHENKIPFDSLTYTQDKSIVSVDYAIDDNLDNVSAYRSTGAVSVVFDQPWNRHEDVGFRVLNLTDFADLVHRMEGDR